MKRIYITSFSSAHKIEDHPKCGKIHGHNYRIKVTADIEPRQRFFDFAELKRIVDNALEEFDHNTLPKNLSTCEELARALFYRIRNAFRLRYDPETFVLDSLTIELYETDNFGVVYP